MKQVTANSLCDAFNESHERLKQDEQMTAASTDAGILITDGSKAIKCRIGYQVFVRMVRWSEKQLRDYPDTGGLLDRSPFSTSKLSCPDPVALRKFTVLARKALGTKHKTK